MPLYYLSYSFMQKLPMEGASTACLFPPLQWQSWPAVSPPNYPPFEMGALNRRWARQFGVEPAKVSPKTKS